MIRKYSFKFDDLTIDQKKIAFILGYGNIPLPDPFGDYIKTALDDVRNLTDINCAYLIFDDIRIDHNNLLSAQTIKSLKLEKPFVKN